MGLLRRPADRQRPARHPPRVGPALQGRVPPVPHDARPLRRTQGRLGLPRPARRGRDREGARSHEQAPDRGLRHRGVQPALPRVGAPLRRGLGQPHEPHRHVARHRQRLLDPQQRVHRDRVVALPSHVGAGRHLRRRQGRPLLRPLRHRALEPRARPTRRVPSTSPSRRSTCAFPSSTATSISLVWTTTPWTLISNVAAAVGPEIEYVRVRDPQGGRDLVLASARVEAVLGADVEHVATLRVGRARRTALRAAVHGAADRRGREPRRRGRLRDPRRRLRHRPPRARIRRDRPRGRGGGRASGRQPGRSRRALRPPRCPIIAASS